MIILIMGLPGSGKTTLAEQLVKDLESLNKTVEWFNADNVRKLYDDWDFSNEGRIRQSLRMKELSTKSQAEYVICDFVAPLQEMRDNFNAHYLIWLDTISTGRFEDTNTLFTKPTNFNFKVPHKNSKIWSQLIITDLMENNEI